MTTMPSIAMQPVASSQIQSIGHDAATNTLAIRFTRNNGRAEGPGPLYHYDNFTAKDFAAFRDAESAGRHFGQHIKPFPDKYPFQRIDESTKDEPAAEGDAA
jgi:hypothetical protein